MGRLERKVAIITGAARGNGEGAARVMAKEGAIVILTDILDKVYETAKSIKDQGCRAVAFKMDVTKKDEVNQVIQEVLKQFRKIDILVNNAGIVRLVNLIDMKEEDRDKIFDVNIKGAFNCAKAVLPDMLKRKYGRIINVSSVTGPLVVDSGTSAYATTKAALYGFTKALAIEVASHGITVNAILPGQILTPLAEQAARETNPKEKPENIIKQVAQVIPMKRFGTIEEFGELAAFLASDEAKYITGAAITLDGGSSLPETFGIFGTG